MSLEEFSGSNLDLLGEYVPPPILNVLSLSTEEGGDDKYLLANLLNLGKAFTLSLHQACGSTGFSEFSGFR